MSEIFTEAVGLAKDKISTQDNSGSVLNYLYSTLENIDPPLTIARKLGLNIPSGEDLTTLVQTVAEGVSPGTDIREMIEGSEEIYKGNVVSGGLQTLGGLAGAAIPFSKQVRGIGKVVGKKADNLLDKSKIVDETKEAKEIIKSSNIKPKQTKKVYKLFKVNKKTGGLHPLFVKMEGNKPIPLNKWVNAELGERSKTGKVKSSLGDLAWRPGFHSGDLPVATHIGGKINKQTGKSISNRKVKPNIRKDNQVWAEVEVADDVDWQSIANSRASTIKSGPNKGKLNSKEAHITEQLPKGGNYNYKTNPNMTGNWVISGEMKINRILDDVEVKTINEKAGVQDLPRKLEFLNKRKGGQIATGLAGLGENIVYRQEGGDLGDWAGADIVGGSFTDAAGGDHGGFADVDIGDDPGASSIASLISADDRPEGSPPVAGRVTMYGMGFDDDEDEDTFDEWYEPGLDRDTRYIDPDTIESLAEKLGVHASYNTIFNTPEGYTALNNMLDRESPRYFGPEHWNPYHLKEGFEDQRYFDLIQSAIDKGDLQRIGMEFANTMETAGELDTFGKNMRSSLEAWTPGNGLNRAHYDPGILIGLGHLTDNYFQRKKGLASEKFIQMLGNAKPGITFAEVAKSYKAQFGEDPPVNSLGFSLNSNAQAREVAGAFAEGRTKGAFQGLGIMLNIGILTPLQLATQGYKYNPKKGTITESDAISDIKSQISEKFFSLVPDDLTAKGPDGTSIMDLAEEGITAASHIVDFVSNPLEKGIGWLLEQAHESLDNISVYDHRSKHEADKAREEAIATDPTVMDSIRDILDFNIYPTSPIPIESTAPTIYHGPNIVEEAQPVSQQQVASLPIAPEEDTANIYGTMAGYFDKPKPPRQNPFSLALLDNIYGPNNLLTQDV